MIRESLGPILGTVKAKVHIETSVVSYYTARPSRDLIIAARQEIARERWPRIMSDFHNYVSVLVLQEAEGGDAQAACARVEAIAGLPALQIDEAVGAVDQTRRGAARLPVSGLLLAR